MVWSADQLTQGDSYVTVMFKQLHFGNKLRTSLGLTVTHSAAKYALI